MNNRALSMNLSSSNSNLIGSISTPSQTSKHLHVSKKLMTLQQQQQQLTCNYNQYQHVNTNKSFAIENMKFGGSVQHWNGFISQQLQQILDCMLLSIANELILLT